MNIAKTAFVAPQSNPTLTLLNHLKQPAMALTKPNDKPAMMAGISKTPSPSMRAPSPPSQGDPCQGGAPSAMTPGNPLTLKELQAAFGTSNKRCDLNGNGTVDMDDLVAFINSQQTPATSAPDQPIATATAAPAAGNPAALSPNEPAPIAADSTALTIDGFHKTWGQSGSEYDLNGDGTVNMDDLVQYIASQPVPAPPAGAGTAIPVSTNATSPADAEGNPTSTTAVAAKQPPLTLDGLLAAWSNPAGNSARTDSRYDLTGDGQVNMDDLTTFINGMAPGRSAPVNNSSTASTRPAAADTNPKKTEQLMAALTNRLNQLGFVNQPPVNIRELIAAMDLSPAQSNTAIRQLQNRYPQGLGVNLVG